MKAPDKIYLHEEDFARIYTQPSSTIDDDIEYIRKDALLEWANNWKQLGQNDDFMYAIEILVRHLNSM